ncbi:hypothetical protein M0R45_009281 [Rubus argutus]|uniref:SEC63 domain-containing protein n=1 Tax=Rubus argutus TaxID=59490 RepID=A0AAW1Y6L2_RUBAR
MSTSSFSYGFWKTRLSSKIRLIPLTHKTVPSRIPGSHFAETKTKYYLKFDTMKFFIQTPINCSLEDAFHVICRAEEIAWLQIRRNEKKLLNYINAYKDEKKIYIFFWANDCLTGDPSVHDLSLTQDMNSICSQMAVELPGA